MTKNKKMPEWDDGRTIANMNVEGMPWYAPDDGIPKAESQHGEQMTKKQMRSAAAADRQRIFQEAVIVI